jgi:hypothetical protein
VTVTSLEINDTPVILDANGQAIYTPSIVGDYTAVAQAQDAFGNSGSATLTIRAVNPADDTTPPVVSIATPAANSEVTAPTAIVGTVQDETLVRYTLEYAVRGENQFTPFASGKAEVFGAELGTFDPTLLRNDLYDIRLTATDINGLTTSITVVYQVTGNLKVGPLPAFRIGRREATALQTPDALPSPILRRLGTQPLPAGAADIAGGRREDAQGCVQGCAPEGLTIRYRLKYLYVLLALSDSRK